jgi:hypothetical protein
MNAPSQKHMKVLYFLRLIALVLIPAILILYFYKTKPQNPDGELKKISITQPKTIESLFKNSKPVSVSIVEGSSHKECINFSFEMSRIDLPEKKISFISDNRETILDCQKKSWFPTKLNQILNSCLYELDSNSNAYKTCNQLSTLIKLHYLSQIEIEDKSLEKHKTNELILKILNSFINQEINQINTLNKAFDMAFELSIRNNGPQDLDNLLGVVVMSGLSHPEFLKQYEYSKLTDSFLNKMAELERLEEVRLMSMVVKKEPIEKFLDYIKNNPNSYLGHYFTAGAYWKLNDRVSTLIYLQQALTLNPTSQQIQKTYSDFKNANLGDKIFTTKINFNFNF